MSAFVVASKTIDRVLTTMADLRNSWIERELGRLGYPSGRDDGCCTRSQLTRLGQDLLSLNTRVVNEKYGDDAPVETYTYRAAPVSLVQGYSSLSCFLYQCAEGDGPDQPLFKLFEDGVGGILAKKIIRGLPEWDAAEWG